MFAKKLLDLLDSFSLRELDRFERFLQSPYFNENASLTALYRLLRGYVSDRSGLPDKAGIWQKVRPSEPYSDVRLRKMVSDLLALALEFKAMERFRSDERLFLIMQMEAIARPALKTHIASIRRKLEALLHTIPDVDGFYYRHRYQVALHRLIELEKDRKKLTRLQAMGDADAYLDLFYYARKLGIAAEVQAYRAFMRIDSDIRLPDGFVETIQAGGYFDQVIIEVYARIYALLLHPEDDSRFFELLQLIESHEDDFSDDLLLDFYSHVLNYAISYKVNTGDTSYHSIVFNISKRLVEKELVFNPYLDPGLYANIIAMGLQLEAFDYVEQFIDRYSDRLPPDKRENARTYNLARLYYNKKDYGRVLELLQDVSLKNISYALGAKIILVGTFYALEEFRALESHLNSFRIFVLRSKLISQKNKQAYLNFLRFTKRLIYLSPYDEAAKAKLLKKVESTENIPARQWLIERIREL